MFSPAQCHTQQESDDFDTFVDSMMLLPPSGEDASAYLGAAGDIDMFAAVDDALAHSIPDIPQEIPTATGPINNSNNNFNNNNNNNSGNLYEQLLASPALSTTAQAPSSPMMMMFPYTPAATCMGSPSSLMTACNSDPAWMHSTRTRRRRTSPPLQYMPFPASPMSYCVPPMPGMFTTSPPMQAAAVSDLTGLPMYFQPAAAAAAPPGVPMNVTVKLPMAPLTPSSQSSQPAKRSSADNVKVPLMLPSHFCASAAAPNSSSIHEAESPVSSRASSVAPGSSVSNCGSAASASASWFSAMTATKDSFLAAVEAIDFSNVTVLEMKQLLRKFGLNSTGKKAQLIERIREIESFLRSDQGGCKHRRPEKVIVGVCD